MDNSANEARLIKILSEHLGVNQSDLDVDDRIKEDLHITMKDFSELMDKFEELDINTSMVDYAKIDTVADLAAAIVFKEA